MAKGIGANFIPTVNEILSTARQRGIVHLVTEDHQFIGNKITIKGQSRINFGSCSYLGLELDSRLIEAGVDAIRRYGSQFSSSRAYASFTLYEEAEDLLAKIFGNPVILSTCSSLGHQAVIPIVMEDNDAIIFDQQAHISMQDTKEKLLHRGISVSVLRHNRLDELKPKIEALSLTHDRVWYFADGIYSMYGDVAPIKELYSLLDQYPKFHLYVDDAHGMSWQGKNGSGFTLNNVALHQRMIVATSLAKGFASAGGVFIIPDHEMYWKVKNWGGPLTYSGPQQPAVIGASIASAKIHLSPEIYELQDKLAKRINYCNEVMKSLNVPLISFSKSPIFYVGLGLTKVGYNMVHKIAEDGFHVNLGIFPAVPETCTGVRFTLTLHHSENEIEQLCKSVAKHLPRALSEEGRSTDDVRRAFKSLRDVKARPVHTVESPPIHAYRSLSSHHTSSIKDQDQSSWDAIFSSRGAFDSAALILLENTFRNNLLPEDNWEFNYYVIKNTSGDIILATLFTTVLLKDDMLLAASISEQVEKERIKNPYYLTSRALMMGTLLTDGDHLYINKQAPNWKLAMSMLLDALWKKKEAQKLNTLMLRDFSSDDLEIRDFLMDQGFLKLDMPAAHIVINPGWVSEEDYLAHLTHKRRLHVKNDVLADKQNHSVEIIKNANIGQITTWYELYNNVRLKNREINSFRLPYKLFEMIANSQNWDCLELRFNGVDTLAAFVFAYKTTSSYCPVIIGINYNLLEYKSYKKILYQAIQEGIKSKAENIFLGLTTSLEKRKMGATAISKCAYLQVEDKYNMSILDLLSK